MTCPDLPPGCCKIGGSAWPPGLYRVHQLAGDYGTLHPFTLADQIEVDDWETVEAATHRKLWRRRAFREVFHVSPAEASAVIRAAASSEARAWGLGAWLRRHGRVGRFRVPAWRYWRRRQRTNWVPALLVLSIAAVALTVLKPTAPVWVPPSMARTVYLLERLH